jgi:protein TonB
VAGLGNPRPRYPWISRRRGEQGRVVLEVAVAADGRAKEVRVKRSSGSARLDRAALAAVRAWRFKPALSYGRAVAGRIDVPIVFRLTQ